MDFHSTRLTAISFYFVIILAQSFGELIVLKYPTFHKTNEWNITCVSEDDDAAIIWNYNPEGGETLIGQNNFTNFQPGPWIPQSNPECLVWNSTDCLAKWHRGDNWNTTKSASRPMSPVSDYRWEGFKEYVFKKSTEKQEILYVEKVDGSSGTTAFSARGSSDVYVYLCKTRKVSGRCLWIILGGWNGTKSAIRSCANGVPALGELSNNKTCTDVASVQHNNTEIIDPYEWRTFRLEWNREPATIKVFRKNDPQPFLSGTLPKWYNVPRVFVKSGTPSRIRFHFYKYYFADRENAKLYTGRFGLQGDNFCANLLVGICPECELSIAMVEKNGNTIETWTFFGDENSLHNQLLGWQSVKLNTTWPNSDFGVVQLVIETISNAEDGKGQWAIDSFRMCESHDGIRESTIMIQENDNFEVKCQKLSYTNSALVTPVSKTTLNDTTELQRFLSRRKGSCGSRCASFGSKSLICDQTGCTCDRGFMGSNCSTECSSLSYGYNCQNKCNGCDTVICNRTTGYCANGCSTYGFLAPRCELDFRTQKPTVTNITDTTAQVLQTIELATDAQYPVFFCITEVESSQNTTIIPVQARRPSTYESDVQKLKPSTRYKVHTTVTWMLKDGYGGANSSETIFTTTCTGKPRFEILPAQTEMTITMPQRDKMCGDSADPNYYIRVFTEPDGTDRCNENVKKLPYMCKNLETSTDYNVSITQSNTSTFSTIVRTLEQEPSSPQILSWFNRGHGIVMLKWMHPKTSETKIKEFRINVKPVDSKLRVYLHDGLPMPIRFPIKQDNKYYSVRLHLFPSTIYNVSVMAVTANDINSTESNAMISVSGSVGFESGEKGIERIRKDLFKLKIPKAVNVTCNTTVSIFVKELVNCTNNQPPNLTTREWFAEKYMEYAGKPNVEIDTNWHKERASNCSSNFERTYLITVILEDLSSNSTANLTSKITVNSDDYTDDDDGEYWTAVAITISATTAISLLLWTMYLFWNRKREIWTTWKNRQDIVPLSSMMTSTGNSEAPHASRLSTPPPDFEENRISIRESTPDVVPYNPHSCSVRVDEFEEYAKEAMASGLLSSQFALLSPGPTKAHKYGTLPANLPKNRYEGVIPYDETRVVLDKIPGDPHSDYINASYVKGYRKEKAYIATQGPLPGTVNDFWRMVWQEQVHVICMLTNVVEDGKRQCEQYWPEVETGNLYGDIFVSNNDHEVFADYTIRTFSLNYKNKKRQVTQFHYTGWPNKGVPKYSQSLVAYIKKLLATPKGKGPVVFHCGAGLGRTGTIILCNICLRRAAFERTFDVPVVTLRMREDRARMVDNIQQYFLAHLIIMESMVYEQTQIACVDGLPKKIEELREQLSSDIQRLGDTVWQDRALDSLALTRYLIADDNESDIYSEMVPADHTVTRFNRDSIFDSESNYVNAVSVDGVKMKGQYLESHLPSPSTISEYWRLINQKRVELILILQTPKRNDSTWCDIMSNDAIFVPVPHVRVETKARVTEGEHFTTRKFLLIDSSEEQVRQQPITVLTCTGWGGGKNGKPPSAAALVALWIASEKISRKEAPTLVLCQDGVTGCGLYLALSFLLERMAVERECDVISAVRAVRRSRTEFVQSLEQFNYLYDVAVNYFECFQTYSNFS